MAWFEIIYAEAPTTKALHTEKVVARNHAEAMAAALKGFANAQSQHGAKCYRIVDGVGMVVARGPT